MPGNIRLALTDGTLYGTLGELPLADAALGNHLVGSALEAPPGAA